MSEHQQLTLEDTPKEIESLHMISDSSSSSETKYQDPSKDLEVERIIQKAVKQLQSISQGNNANVNDLMDLLMPKILIELHSYDVLYQEVQRIKQTLDSYIDNSRAIDQDIADIFLDLHNIYKKLECVDGIQTGKDKCGKLAKRVRESEVLKKRTQYYICNNRKYYRMPRAKYYPITNPRLEPTHLKETTETSTLNNDKPMGISSKSLDIKVESAEKLRLYTNLFMLVESDCPCQFNRKKILLSELQRALQRSKKAKKSKKSNNLE